MQRWMLIITIAAAVTGCESGRGAASEPVLTESSNLSEYEGEYVRIRGVVSNTKMPTIIGVDVRMPSGDDGGVNDLRGEEAEAVGRLERYEIKEPPRNLPGPPLPSRGPGSYYKLVDPTTNLAAIAQPAE